MILHFFGLCFDFCSSRVPFCFVGRCHMTLFFVRKDHFLVLCYVIVFSFLFLISIAFTLATVSCFALLVNIPMRLIPFLLLYLFMINMMM